MSCNDSSLLSHELAPVHVLVETVVKVVLQTITLVLKPGTMATGSTICLLEPLEDGDAKSWFR